MPQNITDVSTFTSPIVAPADGDPENAASVVTAIQGLSNRTRSLLNGAGLPIYATVAALRATAAAPTTQLVAVVVGYGLFAWSSASTAADDGLFTIQATGVTTGRWVSLVGQLGAGNGLAQNDNTGRVPASGVRNGLISVTHIQDVSIPGTSGSGAANITSFGLSVTGVQNGDLVIVSYSLVLNASSATECVTTTSLLVTQPGGSPTYAAGSSATATVNGANTAVTVGTTCVVPVTATGTLAIQGSWVDSLSFGGTVNAAGNSLVAQLIRP